MNIDIENLALRIIQSMYYKPTPEDSDYGATIFDRETNKYVMFNSKEGLYSLIKIIKETLKKQGGTNDS